MSNYYSKESASILALCSLLVLLLMGCSTQPAPPEGDTPRTLTVFAAASLTESFRQMAAAFEKQHPGASIELHFAGSQQLRTQLEHGARADIFASADWRQMEAVEASSLVLDQPIDFATNRLVVVIAGSSSRVGEELAQSEGLEYLARPGLKLVLASPEVPAGAYARRVIQALANNPRLGSAYPQRVLDNLVSEETNVRNVVQKVSLGEADAGIVYVTDAEAINVGPVGIIPIPEDFNVSAQYPIAALRGTDHPELARAFVRFVVGNRGQEILGSYGFSRGPVAERNGQPAAPPAR